MFDFAETTKDMTSAEILNYYRNLYYAEPQVTERGIVANAINDYFADVKSLEKQNAELLVSATTDILVSMEKLVKVRTEHPIFKAIEEKVAREIIADMRELITGYENIDLYLDRIEKKYTEQVVDNAERCVVCGEVIPEGRQVCPPREKQSTEHKYFSPDDVRRMTAKEVRENYSDIMAKSF